MASEPATITSEPRGCPLPGACSALVEIEKLRALKEALDEIAAQRLTSEMDAEQAENADYEGAYNHIVSTVRDTLVRLSRSR